MITLTYNMPNDIHTYVITCSEDMLNKYIDLLVSNGVYKIYFNNEVIYDGK